MQIDQIPASLHGVDRLTWTVGALAFRIARVDGLLRSAVTFAGLHQVDAEAIATASAEGLYEMAANVLSHRALTSEAKAAVLEAMGAAVRVRWDGQALLSHPWVIHEEESPDVWMRMSAGGGLASQMTPWDATAETFMEVITGLDHGIAQLHPLPFLMPFDDESYVSYEGNLKIARGEFDLGEDGGMQPHP